VASPGRDAALTGVAAGRKSPGTGARKGQPALGKLWGRGLEPRGAAASLCDQSEAREHAGPGSSTCAQPGKENTASAEPSPFCQLPCFPEDLLLFPYSITAEQRHNEETSVISGC